MERRRDGGKEGGMTVLTVSSGLGGGEGEQEEEEGTQEVTSYTESVTPALERGTTWILSHSWDPPGSTGHHYSEHAQLDH